MPPLLATTFPRPEFAQLTARHRPHARRLAGIAAGVAGLFLVGGLIAWAAFGARPIRLVLVDETGATRGAITRAFEQSHADGGREFEIMPASLNRLVTTGGVAAELDKLLAAGDLDGYILLREPFARDARARVFTAEPVEYPVTLQVRHALDAALGAARLESPPPAGDAPPPLDLIFAVHPAPPQP